MSQKKKKNYNATENLLLFLFSLTIQYIVMNSRKRLQYLKELYRLLKLLLFLLPIFRVLFLIIEKNILFFQKTKQINKYIQEKRRRKSKRYKVVV